MEAEVVCVRLGDGERCLKLGPVLHAGTLMLVEVQCECAHVIGVNAYACLPVVHGIR